MSGLPEGWTLDGDWWLSRPARPEDTALVDNSMHGLTARGRVYVRSAGLAKRLDSGLSIVRMTAREEREALSDGHGQDLAYAGCKLG